MIPRILVATAICWILASCDAPQERQRDALPEALAKKLVKLQHKAGPRRYDQPSEAAQYFIAQRESEAGTGVDPAKYLQAQTHIARMPAFSSISNSYVANNRAALAPWTDRGPSNVGGRTRVLRFRPGTPSTLYAAAVAGGLWRSTDTGASWTPIGDLLPNISITALAIDPNAPDTMYIGGGEGYFNVDAQRGLGIFKSVDGGVTFAPLNNTFNSTNFRSISDLVISSENSNVLYATTNTGLWRSLDAGATWAQQVNAATVNGCFDIEIKTAVDADADDMVWLSCGTFAPTGTTTGIWRSTAANAAAATWTQELSPNATAGSNVQMLDMGRTTLAIAPGTQTTVYALIARSNDGAAPDFANLDDGVRAIMRSTDSGATWTTQYAPAANPTTTTFTFGDILLTNGVCATQ
jgi:hypothetical protein